MNLFFHWSVFCAHLGVACVPVQRLGVQPHAFSHARLLHKKNYVVLGGQYEGAAVRTMDSPRSDGVLKNRRAEMALPLRLRDGVLRSGAQPALWWVAELRLSAERAYKGGGQRRSDRKSLR